MAGCFLVTGRPGGGKTTLIARVVESLKLAYPNLNIRGFYTREIRRGPDRVGFEVCTIDGRKALLSSARIDSSESHGWPTVGRFKVDVASFESLALPELQIKKDTDLFVIDEIGKMELCSASFFPAVLRILESNIPLLASIPIPSKNGQDIPEVARMRNHPGADIFTLQNKVRDAMQEQIYAHLRHTFVPKAVASSR